MNRRRFCQSSLAAAVAASLPATQSLAALLNHLTQVTSDVNAVTGDGAEVTLKQAAVQELADSLRGNLLLPGSEAYETARMVLNPTIDKRPALIAQPMGSADVSDAVSFARQENLLVAVKCGGHSMAGKSTCDGGMMIDLSLLRSVRVDPIARTARVAGGSLLGELDHDSMAYGLVTTAGTVSHTGVGGITLGGGFGRVARKFGLSLDNVLAVDIITADGKFHRASADDNPELYWGVRGGGGNFGIVTSFEFQLHPMHRKVIAGSFIFPFSKARNIMNFFGEYADSAPDELHVGGGVVAEQGQDSVAVIGVVYCGPHDKADAVIAPIRTAGTVIKEDVKAIDYVALQKSGDIDDPRANGSYLKSGFTGKFTSQLVDDLVDTFEAHPGRSTRVVFQQSGGAIGRVPDDATAFPHRESKHNMLSFVNWPMGTDPSQHIAYIRQQWKSLEPHTRGFYTNDFFTETQQQVNANYRGNYTRLVNLKNQYDPTNLFRLNANVRPTA
ncbi:MAG: FAD-binding oxidoreductase [Proteobacteria bacterium]|nr:FAD-binding oxidoreductase [Pseudomonadota bacterium]